MTEQTKRCIKCGETKPATRQFFHKDRHGLRNDCKQCNCAAKRAYRRRTGGQNKVRTNPLVKRCPNCQRILDREAFSSSKARYDGLQVYCKTCHNLLQRQAYARNPQKRRESNERNVQKHPWRPILIQQRRRARKRNLPNTFTEADWNHCLEYFGHCCAVCRRPPGLWRKLAPDHWIPLSDPRPDNPGTTPLNIVPLCHGYDGCNGSKGGKNASQWLSERFDHPKARAIEKRISRYFAWVKSRADHGVNSLPMI